MKKLYALIITATILFQYPVFAQVSVTNDGSSAAPSAMLEVKSSNKGFLPPRMTSTERDAILNPVEGLIIYCTDCPELQVFNGVGWTNISGTPAVQPCGSNMAVSHTAGNVAPVTKIVNYGTVLTNLSGSNKCWITQNLGADRQATAVNDATEQSAGWYWQFNRKQGFKHDGTTRTPNTAWVSSISESTNWTPENDPCILLLGNGWRLPTYVEWANADSYGGWGNWNDVYASVLKLHAAGELHMTNGALGNRGTYGIYWSTAQYNNVIAYGLYFYSTYSDMSGYTKPYGAAVRCLKD